MEIEASPTNYKTTRSNLSEIVDLRYQLASRSLSQWRWNLSTIQSTEKQFPPHVVSDNDAGRSPHVTDS